MICFSKRLGIILALIHSLVSCNPDYAHYSHYNINGASKITSKHIPTSIESSTQQIISLPSVSSTPNPNPEFNTTASNGQLLKFNFTDSSESAVGKLKVLISSGNYLDVFEKPFEILQSRISINNDSETSEGSVSQQSNSHSSRVIQKEPENDKFFYVSSPNHHTSENCYIIKIKPSVEKSVFEKLNEVFGVIEAKIYKRYQHGFFGYSICFPENTLPLALMKEIPAIEFIERDNVIKSTQIQENAPWGLARLSNPSTKSKNFSFDGTGQGVTVYVIDSGISKTSELGDRGTLGFTSFPNEPADCAGHGTEVASIIAGTNVGVAKKANVVVAQVLDCLGDGKNSDLLDAISWVIETHQKPAIINMSLGGDRSPSIENAVKAAVAAGIPVVVAAGNSNIDACTQSPAAVSEAITVAASTSKNAKAKFSNYGPCVDIFAPGVDILAATSPKKSRNGWNFASGTSFSAPLVSGVSALLLEKNPNLTPAELGAALKEMGASSVLSKNSLKGSPNLLLQAPPSSSNLPILVKLAEPSTLPMLGFHTSSIALAELALIISSIIGTSLVFLITGLALYRRQKKYRNTSNSSISEEELKHSILNSQRPSVFL